MKKTEDAAAPPLQQAFDREDPIALAHNATDEELKKIKRAEEVLELRHGRRKRSGRTAQIAQALVGYVALAGFFANAYQNWNSKKQADERAKEEKDRWAKEFQRAQDADKYRDFFETSALATDPANADRRLVGYALLKEFVDDDKYNPKATFLLEEALSIELRGGTATHGMDEEHRLAVVAILGALAHTSDCKALSHAARTVERLGGTVAKKAGVAAVDPDIEEKQEVFDLYVRRLVGRAAIICTTPAAFREVRRPLRDAIEKQPTLAALQAKPTAQGANSRIAEMLRDGCKNDQESNALTDCPDMEKGYAKLCAEMQKLPDFTDDQSACAIIQSR